VTGDEQELLMRYLDGEMTREEARAFEKRLAGSKELETAAAALTQVREVVVARYERAAEEAAPELDRLWAKIEAGMDAPAAAVAPAVPFFTRVGDAIKAWFEQYRGYVAVGAVSGLAGVLIALSLVRVPSGHVVYQPSGDPEVPLEVVGGGVSGGGSVLVANVSAAEIESLEVEGGSGTIFRIPAEDGEAPTTVIWVTRDVEGPI